MGYFVQACLQMPIQVGYGGNTGIFHGGVKVPFSSVPTAPLHKYTDMPIQSFTVLKFDLATLYLDLTPSGDFKIALKFQAYRMSFWVFLLLSNVKWVKFNLNIV